MTSRLILDIPVVVFQFYLDAVIEALDVPAVRYNEGQYLLVWALEGTIFCDWKLYKLFALQTVKYKTKSVQNSASVQNIRSLGTQHHCKVSHPDCPTAEW
jgi:hypothetical protein